MSDAPALPPGKSANGWRNQVKRDGSTEFAPEGNGRYILYVALACPFAQRALVAHSLKGLKAAIPIITVHPDKAQPRESSSYIGWEFKTDDARFGNCDKDPVHGVQYVQDFYEKHGDFTGPFSVPILYDTKTKRIVNNESSDILRMFDSEFDEFAERPNLHYAPPELMDKVDEINAWVHPQILVNSFAAGSAKTQADYEKAATTITAAMDRANDILSKNRYLVGDTLTEADIRIFVTLIMFDACFVALSKLECARVADRPHLNAYLRELYQLPDVKSSIDFAHIMQMFVNFKAANPSGIVPLLPKLNLDEPHGREHLPGKALVA